ncbi:helix-turn-helix transcriptional regulator [Roseomonas rosulenta]|uniref:helix-turn-helix transcriptional regulator n=1 Tax=Roseomonas rosulenta TaxID=2748667 RepID=UPI0018E03ABA|nr:hypothetical protein [Roseomonas rosulenta]
MAKSSGIPRRIVDGIAAAALEPVRWPVVLGELADLLGANGASIFTLEFASRRAAGISVGDHVQARRAWAGHYAGVRFPRQGSSLPAAGLVFSDAEVASLRLPDSSRYIEDLGRSRHFYDGATTLVTNMLESGLTSATLCLSRSVQGGRFGASEAERLALFVPHLARALQVSFRVATLDDEVAALHGTLEELPSPILLVGARCDVRFANRAARRLIDAHDGLHEMADGLHAGTPRETNLLRRRVADAVAASRQGPGEQREERLRLLRRRGGPPLSITVRVVRAVGSQGGLVARTPLVMLNIDPGDRPPRANAAELCAAYGLTQAEARLALRIATGEKLGAAAGELGVTLSTAKTHLQRVFEKTNTHRQAELVRLLMGGDPVEDST